MEICRMVGQKRRIYCMMVLQHMERGWCPGIAMGSLWNTICRSYHTSHQSRYCQMALFATKSIPCVAATGGSWRTVQPPHSFHRWRVALLVRETYLAAKSSPWVQNHSHLSGEKLWAFRSGPTYSRKFVDETHSIRIPSQPKGHKLQDFFHESFFFAFRRPCGACASLSASAKGTGVFFEAMKWWHTEDGTPARSVLLHSMLYTHNINFWENI